MSAPLLTTKLYIPPPRPNFVGRPRLVDRLNESLYRKLTLISAPAGFGKTSLLSEWAAGTKQPIAWLSLDEEEQDATRFLTYLIAALQKPTLGEIDGVAPVIGKGLLDIVQTPQAPPMEAILTALLNEIALIPDDLFLVLDDYHLVDAKAVDDALLFLLQHLPPQLHIIITTREDPNIPLAQLRARGHLNEIRASDLRFTHDEAADFLNQMMGLNLTAAEIAALESRTEGWIAGLQLAAISMQSHAATGEHGRSAFIQAFTGSHRFIMDYLVEEVLEQQPPHIQSFLLHTSILNRLCASLCDAVMAREAESNGDEEQQESPLSQSILEYLEQTNLFLIPLDNERRWYRYHHLFADLLRQRLQQNKRLATTGASTNEDVLEDVAALHRRASIWYEENNLAVEAVQHALAAKDHERTAGLLEQTWRAMDDSRRSAKWLGWVETIPDELVRVRPVLSAAYGWALLERGQMESAHTWLREAEQWLERLADEDRQKQMLDAAPRISDEAEFEALPATIAAARTYHALATGDLEDTKRYARRTLDLLPADKHLRRGIPAVLLGLAYWSDGELELAYRTFADGVASFRMAGNLHFATTGTYILANMRIAQGRLSAAIQLYEQSLQTIADQGELIRSGSADIYTGLSELSCERGDLDSAAAYLEKSEALGANSLLPRWRYRWCLGQARLKRTQGELNVALELLDEAEREYIRGPVPDIRPVSTMKAQLWIAQKRLDEAESWAAEQGLSVEGDITYLREFDYIMLARLLIVQYHSKGNERYLTDAITLLARLLSDAEENNRTGSVIEIMMLQALAYEAQQEMPSAIAALDSALRLAAPEGYVYLFVNEGASMERLLNMASGQGIAPQYVQQLLAKFGKVSEPKPTHIPTPNAVVDIGVDIGIVPDMVETLTKRELEILELIAQGLSNREICDRLFLAINTVKGHNRRIFGKLQVQRRTEAVAKARALNLLSPHS